VDDPERVADRDGPTATQVGGHARRLEFTLGQVGSAVRGHHPHVTNSQF
jgi:hypothetical protein